MIIGICAAYEDIWISVAPCSSLNYSFPLQKSLACVFILGHLETLHWIYSLLEHMLRGHPGLLEQQGHCHWVRCAAHNCISYKALWLNSPRELVHSAFILTWFEVHLPCATRLGLSQNEMTQSLPLKVKLFPWIELLTLTLSSFGTRSFSAGFDCSYKDTQACPVTRMNMACA